MPRLFVALQLPDSLKQAVGELQSGLRSARWLDEDALHLTLAFIGEVDGSAVRGIADTLETVAEPAPRIGLHGIGCFPPRGVPRVLWIGASPRDEIVSLARTVRRALERAGVTLERRKFMPHVTIARFRRRPSRTEMERYLAARSLFRTPRTEVAAFHLISSVLRYSGARYTIEATTPLERAPGQRPPEAVGAGGSARGVASDTIFEPADEHEP